MTPEPPRWHIAVTRWMTRYSVVRQIRKMFIFYFICLLSQFSRLCQLLSILWTLERPTCCNLHKHWQIMSCLVLVCQGRHKLDTGIIHFVSSVLCPCSPRLPNLFQPHFLETSNFGQTSMWPTSMLMLITLTAVPQTSIHKGPKRLKTLFILSLFK